MVAVVRLGEEDVEENGEGVEDAENRGEEVDASQSRHHVFAYLEAAHVVLDARLLLELLTVNVDQVVSEDHQVQEVKADEGQDHEHERHCFADHVLLVLVVVVRPHDVEEVPYYAKVSPQHDPLDP